MEGGMSPWLVNIDLTFGFLRVDSEALILPEALTLPSTFRKEMSTFVVE